MKILPMTELQITLASYLFGLLFMSVGVQFVFSGFFTDLGSLFWTEVFAGGVAFVVGMVFYLIFKHSTYCTPFRLMVGRWFLYGVIGVQLFWLVVGVQIMTP